MWLPKSALSKSARPEAKLTQNFHDPMHLSRKTSSKVLLASFFLSSEIYCFIIQPSTSREPIHWHVALHSEYEDHLKHFKRRTILIERGIDLDEFQDSFVPATVQAMGWNHYVWDPIRASQCIVQKFYAAMIPHLFLTGGPATMHR
ncbi:hypothetical protein ACOSQ3_024294 [Xanthoceras sorbifolium]